MKITSSQAPAEFQPVTICLTFTTAKELLAAYEEMSFISTLPQSTPIAAAIGEHVSDYIEYN